MAHSSDASLCQHQIIGQKAIIEDCGKGHPSSVSNRLNTTVIEMEKVQRYTDGVGDSY